MQSEMHCRASCVAPTQCWKQHKLCRSVAKWFLCTDRSNITAVVFTLVPNAWFKGFATSDTYWFLPPRPILLYIACPSNTTDSSMSHWFIPPLHTSNRQVRIKLWHLSLSDSHMRVLVEPQLRLLHDTLAHRRRPALNSPIPIAWNVQPTHNI